MNDIVPELGERSAETLQVALVLPLHGPAGLFGPSAEVCAQLAAAEVNVESGVLGRKLRLVVVDGGGSPGHVADEVDALVSAGAVDAVTGWHISAVRQAVARRTADRVPYVYTALYEGGERTPGVFLTGETPDRQLLPAMRWFAEELGVRRWCVVGDDYVWPRVTAAAARTYARLAGGGVSTELYVDLGCEDFAPALALLERSDAEGVLMLLVGDDAVHFNRMFAAAGLDERFPRLSPLMDENMLLASGAEATRGLYATAGYFEALTTAASLDFGGQYNRFAGPLAPTLSSMGESCYEGVRLLVELVRQAGSVDVRAVTAAASRDGGVGYDGPRGPVVLQERHLVQAMYLAEARGLDFDIVLRL
jgi:urea transport system substrate-binding protein